MTGKHAVQTPLAAIALTLMLANWSCSDKPAELNPQTFADGWKKYEGVNFTMFAPPDSPRPERGLRATVKACDDIYDHVARRLEIRTEKDIHIYMFTSSPDCEKATGRPAGFVEGLSICTKLGDPVGGLIAEAMCNTTDLEAKSFPLLREGIRNLFDMRDVNVHFEAAAVRDTGDWPTLEDLLYRQRAANPEVQKYASASFVAFLISRYGIDQFKMLWRSSLDLRPSIEKIYGGTIPQMEEEWFRVQDRLAKRS